MRAFSLFCAVLVVAILAGCGGGGGGGSSTVTLQSVAVRDGWANSFGGWSAVGAEVYIGDGVDNANRRMFLSFDTSAIPAGAIVDAAMLRVYQSAYNHNGYSLGPVSVDHIFFGATVNGAIYDMAYLNIVSPNLSTAYSEGWHELDVSAEVQDDITVGRGVSQYRIYHDLPGDGDGIEDEDGWLAGDSPTNPPELVVTYH